MLIIAHLWGKGNNSCLAILNAESRKKKKEEKSCNHVLYNRNYLNGTNEHHIFI